MNKKAILIVSFGTSHSDTKKNTIDQIELDIKNAYPEYMIYRAFTSKIIIKILKNRDGINISTVAEAMERMKMDGVEEVIVQPTHILNGIENDSMIQDVNFYKKGFNSIKFGAPLLNSTADYWRVIGAFVKKLPKISKHEAIVCMGHGTEHYTNAAYAALDYMLKDDGYDDIYVATVEAYPALTDIIKRLKKNKYNKIILTPFMIVSGDHAKNDMAGVQGKSWRTILEKEGFEVSCVLEGLGENEEIRRIFVDHIKDAKQAATC
nr:sirohydrochlorin cobaltochelatase [uncultured Caproiciproducens sp.]